MSNITAIMKYIYDIHLAVINENIATCKELLKDKNNINIRTSYNMTPLLYACCGNNFEIIKLLIEYGANLNDSDNYNDTPLLTVCRTSCDLQIIKYLVENGANIKAQNSLESTCVIIASANQNCSIECLDYLIKQITLEDIELFIKHTNKNNENCFFSACVAGNVNIMNYLLQYGFNVNEKNASGHTCLMCGFYYMQTNIRFYQNVSIIIDFLIMNGYDINSVNNHGENILCIAMKGYHNFIGFSASMPEYFDKNEHTKILNIAYEKAYDTFIYLVNKGAQIQCPCYEVAKYLKFDDIAKYIQLHNKN